MIVDRIIREMKEFVLLLIAPFALTHSVWLS